jgi:hypothetical protein
MDVKYSKWVIGSVNPGNGSVKTMLNHARSPFQGPKKATAAATEFYYHLKALARPGQDADHYTKHHALVLADPSGVYYDLDEFALYIDPDVRYEMTQDFHKVELSAFEDLCTNGGSVPGFIDNLETKAETEKLAEEFFEFGDYVC